MSKRIQTYKNLSVGDKVMKKSNKPFLFAKGSIETFFFHGIIKKIILTKNNTAIFSLKNGLYKVDGIQYDDIILLDIKTVSPNIKTWRSVNHVSKNACLDYRFSCITSFTYKPKDKEKYDDKLKAFLAAYSLQSKHETKKFAVYKCEHCNFYHVGGEVDDELLYLLEKNILPLMGLS